MQKEIKAMTDQFTNEAIKSKYKSYNLFFRFLKYHAQLYQKQGY